MSQPTAISFQSRYASQAINTIYEELPPGIIIGTLSAADADTNETHTFSFVSGDGDTDNNRFIIEGNQLKLAATTRLDFETKPSYNLRVLVTDAQGNNFEDVITLSLVDSPEPNTRLYNDMGGAAGFGENYLDRNDDSSTSAIDITSIFPEGINFFGTTYTRLFINNNGNLTFNSSLSTFTPFAMTGDTANPIIAAFFTDIDTRAGVLNPSPGGNSTGSNLVYWDFDTDNRTFTVTWDDVGEFSFGIVPNAFQIRLTDLGSGDFSLEYRYESIDWYRGNARAGYSAANGVNFYEFPGSGTAAMLDLEQASNENIPGLFMVTVNSGIPNQRPQLRLEIPDQEAIEDSAFSFTFDANSFVDPDVADVLSYQATLANGQALPAWLHFDSATRTFNGTPENAHVGAVTLRVVASDPVNARASDDFVLTVINTNDAPTDIALHNNAINENSSNDTLIGALATVDEDVGDTHTYQLLDNAGGRFVLDGNELKVADGSLLDYEQTTSHTINVQTTDAGGLSYTKALMILLNNVNEVPISILLSASNIDENSPNASVIGSLSTQDTDMGDSHSYQLIDDAGGRFAIVGNQLHVANGSLLDFETASSHTIRVRSTDNGGLSLEQDLTINVNNIDADLVVSQIVITPLITEVQAANSFDVSWMVVNQGEAGFNGAWLDNVYLDDPNTLALDHLVGQFAFSGAMSLGTPLERVQSIRVPADLLGDYRVVVVTDANNQVNEGATGETNNTTFGTQNITVTAIPRPNLQVSTVTAPSSAFTGREIEVQWTVTNTGDAATTNPVWYDGIWLSADTMLDASDTYLGHAANTTYLDIGQVYANTARVMLPKVEGDYHLLIQADRYDQVIEGAHEQDNVRASTTLAIQQIPLAELADLAVVSVAASSQAFAGQRVNLTYTIENAGQAAITPNASNASNAWIEHIYLSTDTALDANDRLLQTISRNLDADSVPKPNNATHFTTTESIALPIDVTGDFYFFVKVAPVAPVSNAFQSNDEGFTSATTLIRPTPPADLAIDSLTTAANARAGSTLEFNYQISNAGLSTTPATTWLDTLYLSTDAVLDTSDVKLAELNHSGALAPGANYSNNATVTLPNGISGDFYLLLSTDSKQQVYGDDTSNNTQASSAINIDSRPADLVVDNVSMPGVMQAGNGVRVNWQVSNQGIGDTIVNQWTDSIIASTDSILGNGNDVNLGSFSRQGILNASAHYQRSEVVNLPAHLSGDYSIFVVTDHANTVYESDNQNNSKSSSVNIIPPKPSDLQVSNVTVPSTAASGQGLDISYTVKNHGYQTNNTQWQDVITLSTDDVLGNSDDRVIGEKWYYGQLSTDQSYQFTQTITLPNDLQGDFKVFVSTDTTNRVWEASKENNNSSVATTSITIALSAMPDLVITQLDSANSAVAGQALAMSWTVQNNGATTLQNYRTVFYLSRDQILDRSSDIYLGYADTLGGLANAATISNTQSFILPNGLSGIYQVFAVVDSTDAIYERDGEQNNVSRDNTPVTVSLPPLTDLVAGTITVPQNVIAGQTASITYTVSNQSATQVNSAWQDALYLSRDTAWDINDPLFARIDVSQAVAVGGSYTKTVEATLPGVAPGDYHLIVRSDIRNVIPETNESNNISASLEAATLAIEPLTLGVTDTDNLGTAQAVYYRVEVPAGETLRINLDRLSSDGRTELFVSYGDMPSRADFDYRYTLADSPDQRLVVPNTKAGTYYILAYNAQGPASDYGITADLLQFGIEGLNLHEGSNKGQVTLRIDGAKFTTHTITELVDAAGVAHPAEQVIWKEGNELWATFDLRGMATGAYDLKLTDAGRTAVRNDGFTVIEGELGHVEYGMETPPALRPGQQGTVRVYYQNIGDTDVSAPLLTVAGNALLKLPQDADFSGNYFQLLAINSEGPAGILPPNAQGSFQLIFKPDFAGAGNVNLGVSSLNSHQTMDWTTVLENSKPEGWDNAAWEQIKSNLIAQFGSTAGDYQQLLADNATQLDALEGRTQIIDELFAMTFLQASNYGALLQDAAIGVLGRSRAFDWDITATEQNNGDVIAKLGAVQERFTLQTDGSYHSDSNSVLSKQDGAFSLRQADGRQIAFNSDGSFNAIIDNNGNTSHAVYNVAGQLVQVNNDQGASLSFAYNPQGRLNSITGDKGQITQLTYDANADYLTRINTPAGSLQYSYVNTGGVQQVSSITLPNGVVQHFDYDSQGRLIKESSNDNQQLTTYEYPGGNEVILKDSQGNSTHLWLNARGQIAQVENALGKVTQWQYDVAGNLINTVNPDGTVNQLRYDSANNPLSVQDALGNSVNFGYHPQNGLLASVHDQRGSPISYSYDAYNNLNGITYADGSSERYSYDAQGNLTVAVNRRGETVSFNYDAKGHLLQKTYADGTSATFSYDARGNLLQANDADSSLSFEYDGNDRLIKTTDAAGRWLSYSYDSIGRKTTLIDSAGQTTNYHYNDLGQLARLSDDNDQTIASYQYDVDGRLSRGDNGNGTYTTYQHDAAGQLTQLANYQADGTLNSQFSYSYDDMGRRNSMTTLDGATSYSYDATGQLTGVTLPDGRVIEYRYDAAGNRISVDDNGVITEYQTNTLNQYQTVGTASYAYDSDGNLISKTLGGITTRYAYDSENRLISVTTPSDTWQYEYNALGQRIASVHNGERLEYQVDPTGLVNVVAEYDGSGQLSSKYIHGLGLEARADSSGQYYYDFDALGSTTGLTDVTGAYLNRYSYLPFGENLSTVEAVANPFEYVGQWGVMDAGNGLDFMRARFYDAEIGRFNAIDPLNIGGEDFNLYRYANNNPVTYVDASGELFWIPIIAAVAVTGGLTYITFAPFLNSAHRRANAVNDAMDSIDNDNFNQSVENLHRANKNLATTAELTVIVSEATGMASVEGPVPVGFIQWLGDKLANWWNKPSASGNIPIVAPRDPNDILYPAGFGEDHWLAAKETIPYTIRFENQASASAPAQEVTITQTLDSDLDLRSFRLGDFGWGDVLIEVPDNVAFYADRIDLTATQGFMVDVVAGIDVSKGEIFWTLTTVDPNTGAMPIDPTIGFLPTNVNQGEGEGFVNYRIKPAASVTTGAVIDAQATIVFTTQEPIDTPRVFNTLDTQLPSSQMLVDETPTALLGRDAVTVTPEQAVNSAQFLVRWAGEDQGAGIGGYDIYVADNGGAYQVWLQNTPLTEASYAGQPGHSYAFYSIAIDNVGHREPAPAQAGLMVNVSADASLTDTTAPVIASVTLPAAGTYTTGQTLDIAVQFTEKVLLDLATLAPEIALVFDSGNASAVYVSGSGSHTLLFQYTVQTGDLDRDGIEVAGSIDLHNATLRDEAGNITLDVAFTATGAADIELGNRAPTAISLSANTIAENTDTTAGVKIGELTVTDPDIEGNNNVLTLEGADAVDFEIRDQGLFFIGASPDFEVKPNYALTLKSTDGELTYSQAFTVSVVVNTIVTGSGLLEGDQFGVGSNDILTGLASNDRLLGLAGNDTLDGSEGIDTALFIGNLASFTLSKDANGKLTVKNNNTTSNDTDTLSNIERLQFVDQVLALDIDGNAGQVYRLYQAAFDRTPDQAGLLSWISAMDNGLPLHDVANGFIDSAEFQRLYGDNPSDSEFVTKLYNHVLDREPDNDGFNAWLTVLQTTPRSNVLVGFSESPENQNALLDILGNGIPLPLSYMGTSGNDLLTGTVADEYFFGLAGNDRILSGLGNDTVNGGEGLDTAIYSGNRADYTIIKEGNNVNVNHNALANDTDVLISIERLQFEDKIIALDVDGHAGQVYRLYQAAFNRTPDQPGLANWIYAMDNGISLNEIANGFIASTEFENFFGSNPSDSTFITKLYDNVLHREPDMEGFEAWMTALQTESNSDVLIGFSESAENQQALIGIIGSGIELPVLFFTQ